MKPKKHYPLLTAALGAALVLYPGILLIVVMHSSDDSEVNAVIDQTWPRHSHLQWFRSQHSPG